MKQRTFFFIFLFLTACAKTPPQTSRSILETPLKFHSLSAFVQVTVEARGKKESFDAALLIVAPDKLRVEILDDLGQVTLSLVADGSEVLWHDPQEGKYERLPQDKNSLKKALKLPVSVEEFIRGMLLGSSPAETSPYRVTYAPNSGTSVYPKTILWEFRKPKVRLSLVMQDPALDGSLPANKFDTTPPPDARPGKIR